MCHIYAGSTNTVEDRTCFSEKRFSQRDVERTEGFIEENDRGFGSESSGKGDPLLFSTAESCGVSIGKPTETDQLEKVVATPVSLAG
jgi:hypothetical protein